MKLFYYHKIFVQCKLLSLKLDDFQQTLCVYQLVFLLQHTAQEKEGEKSAFHHISTYFHKSCLSMFRYNLRRAVQKEENLVEDIQNLPGS